MTNALLINLTFVYHNLVIIWITVKTGVEQDVSTADVSYSGRVFVIIEKYKDTGPSEIILALVRTPQTFTAYFMF